MPGARRWRLALAVAIGVAALPPSAADASSARAQQLAQLTAELRRTLSEPLTLRALHPAHLSASLM